LHKIETLTPGLISFICYQLTYNYYSAILAGFISISFIGTENDFSSFGISIDATLGSGLFTQSLSFIVFALWLMFNLKSNDSNMSRKIAPLFLWLTLISNAHIVIVTVFFAIPIVIFDLIKYRINFLKKLSYQYFYLYILPIIGSLFWYIPMLVNYNYFVTKNIGHTGLEIILEMAPSIILMLSAILLLALRFKNYPISVLCISSILIFLFSISPIDEIFPQLPFQPFRWISVVYQLSPILIGYLGGSYIIKFQKKYQYILSVSLIIPFLIFLITNHVSNLESYDDYFKERAPEIVDYLKNKQGRVLIEVYRPNNKQPSFFALNALLGENGIDTTYVVFRESSIGSIFMTPLRNSLSKETEIWGIDSLLAKNFSFLNQPIENHLQRAQFMGIKYLLITSDEMVESLDGLPNVHLEKVFGTWKLYQLTNDVNYAQILRYKPNLYMGNSTFKKRLFQNPNLTTLQEYLFLRNENFDTIIAHGNDSNLDNYSKNQLTNFSTLILENYSYSNLEETFNKLLDFSQKGWILFIEEPLEPLQQKILSHNLDAPFSKNIYFIPSSKKIISPAQKDSVKDWLVFFQQISNFNNKIVDFLEQHKIPINDQILENSLLQLKNEGNNLIKLSLKTNSKEVLPLLIKYNYFPSWKVKNLNNEIFLATPTFMLVFAKDDFSLYFSTPFYVTVSLVLSFIAIIALANQTYKTFSKAVLQKE